MYISAVLYTLWIGLGFCVLFRWWQTRMHDPANRQPQSAVIKGKEDFLCSVMLVPTVLTTIQFPHMLERFPQPMNA